MPRPVELRGRGRGRAPCCSRATVGPEFRLHRFAVPPSRDGTELHLRADTFRPGGTDVRELAVAVSGLRLEGGSYGPRQKLAYYYPWLLRAPHDLSFLRSYDTVMANSEFTRGWVERLWQTRGRRAVPADPGAAAAPRARAREGRRHRRPLLRPGPRPREAAEARWSSSSPPPRAPAGCPAGGCTSSAAWRTSQRGYVDEVRAAGAGAPVEVITNAPRSQVEHLLSTSSVFWSATGYGEDEAQGALGQRALRHDDGRGDGRRLRPRRHRPRRPEGDRARGRRRLPLVDAGAARRRAPCSRRDDALRARLAASASERAQQFSEDAFADRWHAIVATRTPAGVTGTVRAVVVNYNGGDEVLGCLRALLASAGTTLEVVVVDNGSTDGSTRPSRRCPRCGCSAPRATSATRGSTRRSRDLTGVDAVLIVNPDAVVAPDCLRCSPPPSTTTPGSAPPARGSCSTARYRSVAFALDGPPRASLDLLAVEGAGRWHLTGPRVRRRWHRGVAWSVGDGSVLRTTAAAVRLTVRAHAPGRLVLTSGGHASSRRSGARPVVVEVPVGGRRCEVVQNAGSVIGPHGVGVNRGYHRPDGPPFDVPCDVPAWCGAAVLLRSALPAARSACSTRAGSSTTRTPTSPGAGCCAAGATATCRRRACATRTRRRSATAAGSTTCSTTATGCSPSRRTPRAARCVAAWADALRAGGDAAARRRRRPAARPARCPSRS